MPQLGTLAERSDNFHPQNRPSSQRARRTAKTSERCRKVFAFVTASTWRRHVGGCSYKVRSTSLRWLLNLVSVSCERHVQRQAKPVCEQSHATSIFFANFSK